MRETRAEPPLGVRLFDKELTHMDFPMIGLNTHYDPLVNHC